MGKYYPHDVPDKCTPTGAQMLCSELHAHWALQGYTTQRFWTEPVGQRSIIAIRSNLVDGVPPKEEHRNV